jgi:hypothetical protein
MLLKWLIDDVRHQCLEPVTVQLYFTRPFLIFSTLDRTPEIGEKYNFPTLGSHPSVLLIVFPLYPFRIQPPGTPASVHLPKAAETQMKLNPRRSEFLL